MDFCIIFNSVCGSTVSTITTIYTEISGVQNLAGTTELSLLQNIYTSSSTHLNENQSYFPGSKVTSADSLITHVHLGRSLKFSGAIPPLHLSSTNVHISQQVTSFWSYKKPFYTSLTCHMHTA